jgi:uncharacterized protein (DUF362 family)
MSGKNKKFELSRRQFISAMGMGTAGLFLYKCKSSTEPPETTPPDPNLGTADVAVTPVSSYERTAIKTAVQDSFEALGGIGDIVKTGDKVGIKINLTGGSGSYTSSNAPLPPYELYLTHPEMVRAVGELVLDAGASELYILESVYNDPADWNYIDPNSELSYTSIAAELGATIINLNDTNPYNGYVVLPVPDPFIYPTLTFNRILNEIDCFISMPKAKNHYGAAVTHGMKNLVGTLPVPCGLYNNGASNRAAIHNHRVIDGDQDNNLVRVILDINRARPIHLVVNDAIKTTLKGEGPWNDYLTPINFNKIIVSKDPVAADTIATQQINNKSANADTLPDPKGGNTINYLKIAQEKEMGINYLPNINVINT